MSLETRAAGVDGALIGGLHVSGSPNTAGYFTERRHCTFAPQSGSLFSPNGVRLVLGSCRSAKVFGWPDTALGIRNQK